MEKIKVVIADDHPIFRIGLVNVIKGNERIELVAEAKNGQEALEAVYRHHPDVIVLDIEMPVLNGIQVAEVIKSEKINTKVLVMTMFKETDLYERAMEIGASGYLLKDHAERDLVNVIELIADGKTYVSDEVKRELTSQKSHLINDPIIANLVSKLSIAEKNILLLIAKQKSTKEIAAELFVSEKTIENHRYNITKKLDLEPGKNTLLKFALANEAYFK